MILSLQLFLDILHHVFIFTTQLDFSIFFINMMKIELQWASVWIENT